MALYRQRLYTTDTQENWVANRYRTVANHQQTHRTCTVPQQLCNGTERTATVTNTHRNSTEPAPQQYRTCTATVPNPHRFSTESAPHQYRIRTATVQYSTFVNVFLLPTVVCLREELTTPSKWPLARIVEVLPGRNGKIHVIMIWTSKGIYKCPETKIVPLVYETWAWLCSLFFVVVDCIVLQLSLLYCKTVGFGRQNVDDAAP